MNTAEAIAIAKSLGMRFEGFRSRPYLCPAGVPSIGFGATFYEDGTAVTLGDAPISRERAERLLAFHILRVFMPATIKLCPSIDTPARLGAISDWTLNLGSGRLRASTLRKKILAGDWEAVPGELRKWVRAGGRVLPGLVARREAEIALI